MSKPKKKKKIRDRRAQGPPAKIYYALKNKKKMIPFYPDKKMKLIYYNSKVIFVKNC
jgi:hypothetical protein